MKKVIIHIGMPKTGSTSIQNVLFNNQRYLENICYPNFGAENHQALLIRLFYTGEESDHIHGELKRKQLEKLKVFFQRHDWDKYNTVLLSGETLCQKLGYDDLKNLHSFLSIYADEITVVGYVRSPKSYIESAFQQTLKFAVFNENASDINIGQRYPSYRRLFEKFDGVFGKENVRLWKFDPVYFANASVVSDFFRHLNINYNSGVNEASNEGLSVEAVSLLYSYLRYGRRDGCHHGYQRSFIEAFSRIKSGRKLKFSSRIIAPILERNRLDIEWIQERIGITLDEDIYKYDDVAVNNKKELLNCNPLALQWLANQLGGDYAMKWHPKMRAQEVAEWVYQLKIIYDNKILQVGSKDNNVNGETTLQNEMPSSKQRLQKDERTYTSELKAKVALAALQGDNINELANKYCIQACDIQDWKEKLIENARLIFS